MPELKDYDLSEFKRTLDERLQKVVNTPISVLKRQLRAKKQVDKFIKKYYSEQNNKKTR